ncbi:MAG TPA: DUF4124 domain-containing protein [Methylomirabilota bacterium]|nr:DUF4124 domain-containing protein [Methylomirabilota bacterium]
MRHHFIRLVVCVVIGSGGNAEAVNRWVDEHGVIHYSNLARITPASPGPPAAEKGDRAAVVEEILKLSGLKRQITGIPGQIQSSISERGAQLARSTQQRMNEIVARSFRTDTLHHTLKKSLLEGFDADQLAALLAWFRSPLSHEMVEHEARAASPDRVQEIRNFAMKLQSSPPPSPRLAAIDRLDSATKNTELLISLSFTVARSMAKAARSPSVTPEKIEAGLQQARRQFYPPMKAASQLVLLYTYRYASDARLLEYAQFWETDAGSRFIRVVHGVFVEAVSASADQFAREILALINESPAPPDVRREPAHRAR